MALAARDKAVLEVLVDPVGLRLGLSQDLGLLIGDERVPQRDGEAGAGGVMEAGVLDVVEHLGNLGLRIAVAALGHELLHVARAHLVVDVLVVARQALAVVDDAADRGLEASGLVARHVELQHVAAAVVHAEQAGAVLVLDVGVLAGHAHLDLGLKVDLGAGVVGVHGVIEAREHVALARQPVTGLGEVVHADDHVLARGVHGLAGRRRAQVV